MRLLVVVVGECSLVTVKHAIPSLYHPGMSGTTPIYEGVREESMNEIPSGEPLSKPCLNDFFDLVSIESLVGYQVVDNCRQGRPVVILRY